MTIRRGVEFSNGTAIHLKFNTKIVKYNKTNYIFDAIPDVNQKLFVFFFFLSVITFISTRRILGVDDFIRIDDGRGEIVRAPFFLPYVGQ